MFHSQSKFGDKWCFARSEITPKVSDRWCQRKGARKPNSAALAAPPERLADIAEATRGFDMLVLIGTGPRRNGKWCAVTGPSTRWGIVGADDRLPRRHGLDGSRAGSMICSLVVLT